MARATNGRKARAWSYSAGAWGENRVRAFDRGAKGVYLEWFEAQPDGSRKRERMALGHSDRELAKAKADEVAAAFRRVDRQAVKPRELTLGALFDMVDRDLTPQKGAGKQAHDRRAAEMFSRYFGAARKAAGLNRRDLERFIRDRRAGVVAPVAAARKAAERAKRAGKELPPRRPQPVRDRQIEYDLRFLHACLNYATRVDDGRGTPLLERNPIAGLRVPREESPQRPVLVEEQYAALLAAAAEIDWRLQLALVLCNETGHRLSAVRQLRWSDVDLDAKVLTWREESDKLGMRHETPLTDSACEALRAAKTASQRAQMAIGDGWVFPGLRRASEPVSRSTMLHWWHEAEDAAKIGRQPRRGFHSLRRKFATELKHAPLRDVAHLGGWKSVQTLLTCYQQPDTATQRAVLAQRKELRAGAT